MILGSTVGVLPILGNMRWRPDVPWALPITALVMLIYWFYLSGRGGPRLTKEARVVAARRDLPARGSQGKVLGTVFWIMVFAISFRLVMPTIIPVDKPSLNLDVTAVPLLTQLGLLLSVSLVAGVSEELALRGYLQRALEDRYGIVFAVLVSGLVFWAAHLNNETLTWTHLPFHMTLSIFLGLLSYLTRSLIPAIAGHTLADAIFLPMHLYQQPAFTYELLHARPFWESPASPAALLAGSVAGLSIVMIIRALLSLRRDAL